MKNQFWMSACLGGVLAGLVWAFFPVSGVEQAQDLVEVPFAKVAKVAGVERVRGRSVFEELEEADSIERKLAAVERLHQMDLTELRREMAGCPDGCYNRKYTFGIQAMVLRMAEVDPPGALDWIREKWPNRDNLDSGLNQAWRLVCLEWAHQDSLALLDVWADAETRLNDPFQVHDYFLSEMLLAGRPLGWMTLYHVSDFPPMRRERFVSTLKSGDDFWEALDTWNHPPAKARKRWERGLHEKYGAAKMWIEQQSNPRMNPLAQKIIRRWREVDEAGFVGSEFVGWERGGE
ncbi:MAG: hypothetical protein ACJA1W_003502 [Akkermansiaceae bacterium]|jgi:hypothetical protein